MLVLEVNAVAWSYRKLWILLIDKKMKRTEMMREAGITSTALAKMGKDEPVTMEVLGKICKTLNCQLEDIIEYIPDKQ